MKEEEIRRDERTKCWRAISRWIRLGALQGNGCDKVAERNGLILAANEVAMMGINPDEETRMHEIRMDSLR